MSRSPFAQLDRIYGTRLSPTQINEAFESRIALLRQEWTVIITGAEPRKDIKIGIIGGGFAGLYAAHLMRDLYEIRLFEARSQLGGRVRSEHRKNGRIIEQGAELIGLNHVRVLDLIARFGLGFNAVIDSACYDALNMEYIARLNRRNVSGHELRRLYHELEDILLEFSKRSKCIVDPAAPWKNDNADELDHKSVGDFIKEFRYSSLTVKALEAQFENNNGIDPEEQSYLGMLSAIAAAERGGNVGDYWRVTEFGRCSRGNQQIAECLQSELMGIVQKDTTIQRIQYDGEIVRLFDDKGDEVGDFNYVILAIPPSVWNDNLLDSDEIRMNASRLMHKAVKFSVRFEDRFWLKARVPPTILTDTIGLIWEPTENQLHAEGQDVSMMVFSGGKFAKKALDAPSRIAHYARGIRSILGATPRIDKTNSHFCNWPEEENTKCGYSCPGRGMVTTIIETLNQPFNGKLFFAGEHTSPNFFGYMEGALQSAERAVCQIVNTIQQ